MYFLHFNTFFFTKSYIKLLKINKLHILNDVLSFNTFLSRLFTFLTFDHWTKC